MVLSSADIFQNQFVFFSLKTLSEISVEGQIVWIQICRARFGPDLGPYCFQRYQRTLVSKEFMMTVQAY